MSDTDPRFEFPHGPIVEVLWIDSAGGHGWLNRGEELANDARVRAMRCRSVGYVYQEDDQVLALTMGWSGTDFLQCTSVIPKFAIVKFRVLKVEPIPTEVKPC